MIPRPGCPSIGLDGLNLAEGASLNQSINSIVGSDKKRGFLSATSKATTTTTEQPMILINRKYNKKPDKNEPQPNSNATT